MGIQDEDLAGLSAEERAALEEEDTTEVAEVTEDPVDAAPEAQAAEAPAAAATEVTEDDADDYDEPFIAQYQADPVEGYTEKLTELDTLFENGEVTLKDYNAQREALLKQQLKAEIAHEQKSQAASQRWQWEIDRFMEDNSGYQQDPIMYAALDAAIKNLANKPENADKNGRWFLSEAHKAVQSRFGKPAQTQAPASQKPGRNDVPRTLSTLPAADVNDAGGSEFAHIEALFNKGKVVEAERLLSKMTPDQQSRYLEGVD
jgi:hypothetical protein